MCGIVGAVSQDRNLSSAIAAMNESLRHRGPDDKGFFTDQTKGVYLGHRRLAIIDLSERARQPIFNENKTIAVVMNGEIYNFVELRRELKEKGHRFSSESDSEVVVHAYEQWHEQFLDKIRGMFAIGLWDGVENKLLLARDQLGIKPLYYLQAKDALIFSSELKAFFHLTPDIYQPDINPRAVEELLLFPFLICQDVTILKDVCKVPAGHVLIVKNRSVTIRKFWELKSTTQLQPTFKEATDDLEKKLLESVKLHLQSDVPVGVLLSGGLDSSLLTALALKVSGRPIRTFTFGFDHPLEERPFARRVAEHLRCDDSSIEVNFKESGNRIEEIISSFDDLSTTDGGIISTYLIAEKIRESGIKVILTAEGADEVFGGYPWFRWADSSLNFFPGAVRNSFYYHRIAKNFINKKAFRASRVFGALIESLGEKDYFRQISKFEIAVQLPNHFLMKVDKATMAHSLEARVPYVDKDIVQYAYNLPKRYKQNPRDTKTGQKVILREIAGRYLPAEIIMREKRSFSLPVAEILVNNIAKVRNYIMNPRGIPRGLFSAKKLEEFLNFQKSPFFLARKEKETLLWKLFILEVWRSRYFPSG